jgi:sodium-independent sulfate anion transporter 11
MSSLNGAIEAWSTEAKLRASTRFPFEIFLLLFLLLIFPRVGFSHAGPPKLSGELVKLILPELPAIIIILIIEHIAIAKSFGRMFNYTVIASQEILAQGASNVVGPFVGGYSCTGSFGASAVLSKAGVRTPAAGLFSAGLLVLALYVLTGVFFYIPMAALAALIIHAVSNLVATPATIYGYWRMNPIDLFIWVIGVVVAFFSSLEISMYVTISISAVVLLLGIARSNGKFMGSVKVYDVTQTRDEEEKTKSDPDVKTASSGPHVAAEQDDNPRYIFAPLDRKDGSNPNVEVKAPYPGVIIYRFPEGFNYTNHGNHIDALKSYIEKHTRRTTKEKLEHPSVSN